MASGDALCVWRALDNEPPDADYATLDSRLTASADEPDDVIPFLACDDGATNEFAAFSGVMPEHYGGGGLTLTLMWSSAAATTGDAKWEAAFKSFTDDVDDQDSKAYAAAKAVTATTASGAGEIDYADIAFTDGAEMDSIAKNEYFRLTINADSADAAHTLVGDAELIAVYLTET